MINDAGVQVRINGHLFARHRVQGESCDHLGDTPSTLCDHDEVDDHQDQEDDETDYIIACDDEFTKGLNDLTRRVGAGVTLHQHHSG